MTHQSKAACNYPRRCTGAARFIWVILPRCRWPHGGKTCGHESLTRKLKDLIIGVKLQVSLYVTLQHLFWFIQCCRISLMHSWRILVWRTSSPSSLLTSVFTLILFAEMAVVKPGPSAFAKMSVFTWKRLQRSCDLSKIHSTDGLWQMW